MITSTMLLAFAFLFSCFLASIYGDSNNQLEACEKNRNHFGYLYTSGSYYPGFNGTDCKFGYSLFNHKTPTLDLSSCEMTKDLKNNSICLEHIKIQSGSDPADLDGIHVELVIEGKLKPRGWPILFEQTHTEFMFKQLNLTLMSGLEEGGTMFCLELQHFNLTVHSTSGMIEVLVWIDALPIDYSDSYQARWIVGDMTPTSIRGGGKESVPIIRMIGILAGIFICILILLAVGICSRNRLSCEKNEYAV
ncbi:uncharacterized protein LOC134851611 isoform X1 [Symsagittifera roscoffensis]|uniref:uncharacterized protein LOC134851611 isoform X1 n=1 Tax=Symsagittifera roscoffensis TaxID=84072 RepID=UPI00307BAD1B